MRNDEFSESICGMDAARRRVQAIRLQAIQDEVERGLSKASRASGASDEFRLKALGLAEALLAEVDIRRAHLDAVRDRIQSLVDRLSQPAATGDGG